MTRRYANKDHLSWVHESDCLLQAYSPCDGPIQAHHLMRPWNGSRGTGMKANDRNLIPLCSQHHRQLHDAGDEDKYFKKLTGHIATGRNAAQVMWLQSPHYEKESK